MDDDTALDRTGPALSAAHPGRSARAAVASLLALAMLLAACGSSSNSASAGAQSTGQVCRQVEAVLSDGPEPEADPVGYAQAQILPLRQLHAASAKLSGAIDRLASAYQAFSESKGSGAAKSTLAAASRAIDTICPGVS